MSRTSKKRRSSTHEERKDIREFLLRELPPGKTRQALYLEKAVLAASARYERYHSKRNEWLHYRTRRKKIEKITRLVEELALALCELDIVSRDDLASRIAPDKIETLAGSLLFLRKETTELANEIQDQGRPRELAEERWISELADIYEKAFSRPARISGSSDTPLKGRGQFHRMLELSCPEKIRVEGKFTGRQIKRALKRRLNPRHALRFLGSRSVAARLSSREMGLNKN